MVNLLKHALRLRRRGLAAVLAGTAVFMLVPFVAIVIPLSAGAQWQVPDKKRPAYEVYKNLKLFHDDRVSVEWLERTMNNLNRYLGVECAYCHDQNDWAKDDLNKEQMHAREMLPKMWTMVGDLNLDLFNPEGLDGPACWTCHRGSTKPERSPPDGLKPRPAPEPSPFKSGEGPAGEVYENIKVFQRRTAAQLQAVMGILTAQLGVECTHCHVEDDWASDEKEPKQTTRKMYAIRRAIRDKYFDGERVITCWTCHRGSTEPEMRPPS